MKVIIAGSRDATPDQVRTAIHACPWISKVSVVISGTALGADEEGERWAHERGIPVERFPADWKLLGKSAGHIRNREMSKNADGIIAVWDGRSRGTQSMIEFARSRGLRSFVYRTDGEIPEDSLPTGDVADRWDSGIAAPRRSEGAQQGSTPIDFRVTPNSGSSKRYSMNTLLAFIAPDSVISVGRQPYRDGDHLRECRERLRNSHMVSRSRDRIECVAYAVDGEVVGEQDTVRLGVRPDLTQNLLNNWLARSLASHSVRWGRGGTIEYVSQRPDANLLSESLLRGVRLPPGVGRRVAADFAIRRVRGTSGQYRHVIVIDVRTRITIDCTLATLIGAGLDPRGLYAVREVEGPSGLRRRLAGRILAVSGDSLILDTHDAEVATLLADEAWLEPRAENLARVVQAIAGPLAPEIQERLHRKVGECLNGPARLDLVNKWVAAIRKFGTDVAQGIHVRLDSGIMRADTGRFPSHELYERPRLVFDVALTKTETSTLRGLDKFGPYNFERFPNEKPNIAIVCEASRQGEVERFVKQLLDGIPNSQWAGKGLITRYHLKEPTIRTFLAQSASAKHYREAVAAAIDGATSQGSRWHLAFIQTEDSSHNLRGDDNPYLLTKALFLAHQVPTQAFRWESIRPGADVQATINNIGLATYAKLEGTPWLLPVHQAVARELVVGIGSFEATNSRLGGREKYIGVATVFSVNGRYFLESRTPATPVNEYVPVLLAAIERAVSDIRRRDGWTKDDRVRLVFHVFKDLKNVEVDAVKQLMQRLQLPHAEFAFIHLVKDHPFMLFDPAEGGVGKYKPKGEASAPKGLRVDLGEHEALVCLKGASDLRRWTDGLPRPLLLRLHPASTFKDLSYLARQVFDFTFLSWRTLFASSEPISVLYADLVAENLLRLRDVSVWAPETILGPVGRGRWFL